MNPFLTRSKLLEKINNLLINDELLEKSNEIVNDIKVFYETYNNCLLSKEEFSNDDDLTNHRIQLLKNQIIKLDKFGVINENLLPKLDNIYDSSIEDTVLEPEKENKSLNERIEDYGEYVFGARKHFYQKSKNALFEELNNSKDLSLDVLIDKFQKRNLWSFKNETMSQIEDNNVIFFLAQSVYNMIPSKISFSKDERKDSEECIDKLKSYMYSVNHFKEMVHTAIELDKNERMPIANFVNQMVNYRNVLRGYAQDPQQFLFDELDEDRLLADRIYKVVKGTTLRGSPLFQIMNNLDTVKTQYCKMMFNEVYPETKEVSYDQFQDYVESGGHIYDGSAIKQFIDAANGKLDYTYLSRQFERLEDSLGQELFLNMIVTGNKPFSDALFKNVEKILESDKSIKTPLDFEKDDSKLNYLLSLYRFKFDSKYSIPDIYIKDENQHTQVITDLSSTDKFDGLVRKILKDQEPNRLDLRYPSIVSGLAHETSKNFRHGENVNPEQFSNVFGFRAIQFGNWVTQQERQHLLNITFDGLSELRDALGFDSKNISLNGTLAIAFGARGQAGRNAASAHYEYASKIFNLTKQNGAGCLAHEWFHGLDAYMAQLVRKDVEKLIYKSGNFESVENNYFLTHLMSDVDYKTCKTVIDNNPLLKSVYELQLKLNGKMHRDEIFSENGKELIVNRIHELVDSNLIKVNVLKDAISKSLEKQGLSRIASLLDGVTTNHVDNVKKLKNHELTKNIKNYLVDNDLHIKRDQMYSAVKTIFKELQNNNAPVGKYTIANPITREFNSLVRGSQVNDDLAKSEKEILKHLRSHKIIKEMEKLLHESVFYLVQRQTLPLFIDQVNSIGGNKISILKGVALDHYQSYMEKSFQTGKGIANKLDLDLVFNNNNFASQSKLLDKDKKQYFSLVAERFARCGEALVTDLLAEKSVQVDYLVTCMEDPQTVGQRAGITPSGNDRTEILKAFKSVIEACRSYAFNLDKDIKEENEVNQKLSTTLSFGAN